MTQTSSVGSEHFRYGPDPDNSGWMYWEITDPTRYNAVVLGRMLVRRESRTTARVRIFPKRHLTNTAGNLHGGAILGFVDVALFAAMHAINDMAPTFASTIEVSTQFMAAGNSDIPLDAIVEISRETRRLCFLRGVIVQDEITISSFSGIVRKAS